MRLGHAERLQALLAVRALRIEIALHDVIFVVDLRQAFLRLDEDHPVHAVADMHGDRRGRAMIDEETRIERLEREHRTVARRGQRRRRAAARAVDRVQVDVVRILVVGMIVEMKLDLVAFADADEFARHMAAESPECVAHAVGKPPFDFPDLQMHDDLGRMIALDRRRNIWRIGQDRVFLANNRSVEVLFARGAESGAGKQSGGKERGQSVRPMAKFRPYFPPRRYLSFTKKSYQSVDI